jgi:hypothetical protein
LISGVQAQEDLRLSKAEIRKLQREQQREEKAAMDDRMAEMTRWMIDNQNFVLQADYLSDRYGSRVSVSSNINFLLVDSMQATMQLGSAFSVGYNGVGGTTIDGRISKYEVNAVGKKKDSWNISMIFRSSQGTYDISLMVSPTGYADAIIRGNWSGELNYHGSLVPIAQARIYKGSPSF